MLQRSSLPSTSTAEIADTLQRSLDHQGWGQARWRHLQDILPLPVTWRQYLLACIGLSVVFGGMLLHVLLSVQIARADFELRQLRVEHARIERQNSELVYQIAQRSSLAQMAALAAQQGYVPATGRTYIVRGSGPLVDPTAGGGPGTATATPGLSNPASNALTPDPASWLQQSAQWWHELRHSAETTTAQLWRDITGRVE